MIGWRARAICRDVDPELFFPISEEGPSLEQIEEAKAICGVCDARPECLRWAVENSQEFGIWGGLTETERHPIVRAYLLSLLTPKPRCVLCDRVRPIHRYGLCKACHSGEQVKGRLEVWAERTKAEVA